MTVRQWFLAFFNAKIAYFFTFRNFLEIIPFLSFILFLFSSFKYQERLSWNKAADIYAILLKIHCAVCTKKLSGARPAPDNL